MISPTSVTLNKTTLSLVVGATETLVATILPANATNKNVTWSAVDSTIATVDTKGKVVAVKAGTTKITVKTVDGNKSAECALTVTAL
ncbi:Ig-like domain-containing protein [Enterococcus faecium]|uniref:Ig-like domain-containing protein n=1 Tax=Enterococcus faecium TaxID=1352 RepID=UPI003137F27D